MECKTCLVELVKVTCLDGNEHIYCIDCWHERDDKHEFVCVDTFSGVRAALACPCARPVIPKKKKKIKMLLESLPNEFIFSHIKN